MKKTLYLGLDPSNYRNSKPLIHYPVIQILPFPSQDPIIEQAFQQLSEYTHLIFTSKTAVNLFFRHFFHFGFSLADLEAKILISVGSMTAKKLQLYGLNTTLTASNETAEGIIDLLVSLNLAQSYLFWPHSALSRPIIKNYLDENNLRYYECALYDTQPIQASMPPPWHEIDEIVFTSPSSVDAFLTLFGQIPNDKKLISIGPITEDKLRSCVISSNSSK